MGSAQPNQPCSGRSTRPSLLLRLKDGRDGAAWREFHDIYARLILGYVRRVGSGPDEAEDLVQEVCIKVFRQIHRFDYSPARGRFCGWLRTIACNTVIDCLRDIRGTVLDSQGDVGR